MKAFIIIVLIIAAVLFGMKYSAEHSRKSLSEYQQDEANTRKSVENEKHNVEKVFEFKRQEEQKNR